MELTNYKVLAGLRRMKLLVPHTTIKFQLMIVLVTMSLLPATIINLFYFYKLNASIEGKIQYYNTELINQVEQKLDFLVMQTTIVKQQMIATAVTSELFKNYDKKTSAEKIDVIRRTDDILRNLKRSFPYAAEFYLIGYDNTVFSTNWNYDKEKLLRKEWITGPKKQDVMEILVPTHTADYHSRNYSLDGHVVSFINKIADYAGIDAIGIVQVDVDYKEIKRIVESANVGENGFLLLVDRHNRIIYDPEGIYLGQAITEFQHRGFTFQNTNGFENTSETGNTFIVNNQLKRNGWRIIGVIPKQTVISELKEASRLSIFISVMLVVFSLFLSFVISDGITKPIVRIIKMMRKVGEGQFDISVPHIRNRDLNILADSFNIMVNKINVLMKSNVDKESEKTNAQLKALQAQINPHFLYNTLEVVRSIAAANSVKSIVEICKSLADMFRYSINKEKEIVTIGEELVHIRNYISIQKFRYEDKFDVFFDVDQSILTCKVIRLIIQPLVENAVYHGIEMKRGKGNITIRIQRMEGSIHIQIIDDGVGMTEEKADAINRAFQGIALESETGLYSSVGIGLINVNSRIKLSYGERYGLRIKYRLNNGTEIDMSIPAIP